MRYVSKTIFIILIFTACSKSKRYAVTTLEPSNIKATSVLFTGSSNGSLNKIDERGFCYHVDKIPIYGDNNVIVSNASQDNFTANVKELKANTNYFMRAFSKLNDGTIYYGSIISFSTNNNFVVGDIGPAGGIIFYMNGYSSPKYAEAIYLQNSSKSFGCTNKYLATSNLAMLGFVNSETILQNCGSNSAAAFCKTLNLNGKSDWCLPSINDLYNLNNYYNNYNVDHPLEIYWSSTDVNTTTALAFDFDLYYQTEALKTENLALIAVRYFDTF